MRGLSDAYGSWKMICIARRCARIASASSANRSTPSKCTVPDVGSSRRRSSASGRRFAATGLADQRERFADGERRSSRRRRRARRRFAAANSPRRTGKCLTRFVDTQQRCSHGGHAHDCGVGAQGRPPARRQMATAGVAQPAVPRAGSGRSQTGSAGETGIRRRARAGWAPVPRSRRAGPARCRAAGSSRAGRSCTDAAAARTGPRPSRARRRARRT